MPKTFVKTGKATAPPPSDVAPAMNDPKTIVTEIGHVSENIGHHSRSCIATTHAETITAAVIQYGNREDGLVEFPPDDPFPESEFLI
jgi:hypothetical protein